MQQLPHAVTELLKMADETGHVSLSGASKSAAAYLPSMQISSLILPHYYSLQIYMLSLHG
jgi:hypothetical protein